VERLPGRVPVVAINSNWTESQRLAASREGTDWKTLLQSLTI